MYIAFWGNVVEKRDCIKIVGKMYIDFLNARSKDWNVSAKKEMYDRAR